MSEDTSHLDRVNIIGTSGSGKSTFAKQLSEKLSSPLVEMDRLFWESNWTAVPDDIFFQRIEKALQNSKWVLVENCMKRIHAIA